MMASFSYMENLARYVLICHLTLTYFYLFHESPRRKNTTVYAAVIKDCGPGLIGRDCDIPCPYPGFGKGCQETCNCGVEYCDREHGCQDGSQTLSPAAITGTICQTGFFGIKCEDKCRYPSYGHNCQQQCLCREDLCNHVSGCLTNVCEHGFIGITCENKCRYPSYGRNCEHQCLCREVLCNHVSGCQTNDVNTGKNSLNTTSGAIGFTKFDTVLTTELKKQSKNTDVISENKMTTSIRFSSSLQQGILVLGVFAFILFILYACTFVMSSYGRFRAHQDREFILEINNDPINDYENL